MTSLKKKQGEFGAYESAIVGDLVSEYGHDRKTALEIFNMYLPVLNILDRYDNPELYAARFHKAWQKKYPAEKWLLRIYTLRHQVQESGTRKRFI